MADRDLTLGVKVVGAPEAKAELDGLKQSTDGVVASQTETTASATAATGAIAGEGAAAAATGAALRGSATGAAELTGAQAGVAASATTVVAQENRIVLALQEARAAFIALATAGTAGSVQWTIAMSRVSVAVAAINGEIAIARLSGGIVTPAQMAGAESYTARLGAMIPALGGVGAASAGAAAGGRLLTTATTQAAGAIAGKTVQVGALGGSLLRLIGPIGTVITVLALIPAAIKLVIDKTREWSTWLGETIAGLRNQEGATRKAGESTQDYQKRVNAAADEQETYKRALDAASAGIIENTGNVKTMSAALTLHQAAIRGTVPPTKEYEAAAKELGITLTETYSGETRQSVESFLTIYAAKLKEGKASADGFATANKASITKWIEAYESAHKDIPPTLVDIAAKLKILTDAQKAVADELNTSYTPALRAHFDAMNKAREGTGEFAEANRGLGLAIEHASSETYRFADGMLISNSAMEAQKTQLDQLIDGLNSLAAATTRVKEAAEATFIEPGFGGPGFVPMRIFTGSGS